MAQGPPWGGAATLKNGSDHRTGDDRPTRPVRNMTWGAGSPPPSPGAPRSVGLGSSRPGPAPRRAEGRRRPPPPAPGARLRPLPASRGSGACSRGSVRRRRAGRPSPHRSARAPAWRGLAPTVLITTTPPLAIEPYIVVVARLFSKAILLILPTLIQTGASVNIWPSTSKMAGDA